MANEIKYKNKYGRTTVLTLNVLYTLSIVTFLHAISCFFYLNIKGVIFNFLLGYSLVNLINILFFYKHKNILTTYHIGSVLGFITILSLSYYSGGINSPVISFLVLLIFFGYLIHKKLGNLWLVLVVISVAVFYIASFLGHEVANQITAENKTEFNLIFLLFSIILLGGVFGRMMNGANTQIKKAKQEIMSKNNEKSVMLKEIHHRVKNNLQTVNSLLRIQARGITDENVKSMFKVAQSRIVAMARLHEKIYKTKDLKHIDVNEYIKLLINDLISSYNLDKEITTILFVSPLKMSIDTLLPLSLIINEFVSNSLKHAFNHNKGGEIYVELKNTTDYNYELIIGDNGIGVTNNELSIIDNSTGMILIKTFVRQLRGEIKQLDSDTGLMFKISFLEIEA